MDVLTKIYVQLLDEETTCYRPVEAIHIRDLLYKITIPRNYDPEDEHWEFKPETIVKCEMRKLNIGEVLVAVEKAKND